MVEFLVRGLRAVGISKLIFGNAKRHGHEAQDAYGEVSFDRLRFVFRTEPAVRAAMVQTGEADFAMFVTPEQCADADAQDGTRCIVAPSDSYLFLRPDVTGAHPAMEDIRVRQAIFHAVDREAIIEHIMGNGQPLGGQMLTEDAPRYNPEVADYDYDPERAPCSTRRGTTACRSTTRT